MINKDFSSIFQRIYDEKLKDKNIMIILCSTAGPEPWSGCRGWILRARRDRRAGRRGRTGWSGGGSGAPRSAPTARPAWWDGVSHVVTRPARLDHLRAVGPLAFRWTTVFREPGGPTAFKWSNRTQVVQADRPRHDMRDAVPPCGTRRRGGAGAGGAGTAPLHPVRPRRPDRRSRRAERPASVARYGGDPLRGPALRRGTRPRKGGRRVLHRPGSTAVRRGRALWAFLTGRDGPWVQIIVVARIRSSGNGWHSGWRRKGA